MPSIINASTTLGLISTADTSGVLQLQTANTTALTIDASQNVSLAVGTANGVTYLNGSKVLTSGSALNFNGTSLAVGDAASSADGSRLYISGNVPASTQLGIKIGGNANTYTQQAIRFFDTWFEAYAGYIGFTTNSLTFGQGTTEGMRLTSTGLGIGTSSPSSKLDVSGTGTIATLTGTGVTSYLKMTNTGQSSANGFQVQTVNEDVYVVNYSTAGNIFFSTNGSANNDMTIDSSGNFLLGSTTASKKLVTNQTGSTGYFYSGEASGTEIAYWYYDSTAVQFSSKSAGRALTFLTADVERARIDSSGNLLVGTTNTNPGGADINGIAIRPGNFTVISALGTTPFGVNRGTDDGILINLSQAGTTEGTISVSGTTVSYNGGHLSRWAQMLTTPELFKGTVMSNLDEMNVYIKDGQPVDNEQLNKVKVSDTEGDVNVAGVFVNWSHDEDHNVDEINMAMTGDMIIRIAQGVTVVRGDLLMSAGDGTAKPQGDDIIRSKTVAKVTSNHVTCTYADGSYCVPCVLMAC